MAKTKISVPVNLVTLSAAVIVVAFFLPWVKFGGSFSGYEIPDIARVVGKATSFRSWTGRFDINVYLVYALYLVPIGAVAVLALGINGNNSRPVAWVTAAMPLAGFVFGLIRMGFDIFSRIGLGGWLTILAAIVMMLSLLEIVPIPLGKGRRR